MDVVNKKRELFLNNLLLLGFNKFLSEEKIDVKYDKNMFCLPNQKMFEIVTKFLFSKLEEAEKQKYPLIWPLYGKDQYRQFQKSCYTYLCSIAQESNIRFPRVVPSVFSSFFGDRLYDLYFSFSTHVVQKVLEKNFKGHFIRRPVSNPTNSNDIAEMLQISTILSVQKLRKVNLASQEHLNTFSNCARDFTAHAQKLKTHINEKDTMYKKKLKDLQEICSKSIDPDSSLVGANLQTQVIYITEQKKHQVIDSWKYLQKFFEKEEHLWYLLGCEVDESKEKYILDALKYSVQSDNLPEELRGSLEKDGLLSSNGNESACILRFLNLVITCLEYHLNSFQKSKISGFHETCSFVNSEKIGVTLKNLKELNEKMSTDLIPQIKQNVEKLKKPLRIENSKTVSSKDSEELFSLLNPIFLQKQPNATQSLLTSDTVFLLTDYSMKDIVDNTGDAKTDNTRLFNYESFLSPPPSNKYESDASPLKLSFDDSFPRAYCAKIDDAYCQFSPVEEQININSIASSEHVSGILPSQLNISDIDLKTPDSYKCRPSWKLDETLNSVNSLSDCSLLDL